MIKQVKKSKFKKTVAIYLAMMILLETLHPMSMYALTSGPTQPEFNAFTPIGTSDMVDLASGDFNYNIPIMDVGGYPLNLAYNSGVTMDQEASWTGLGWNLNVGQIERQIRGLPDDFKGDQIVYENNLKKNQTVGFTFRVNPQILGFETGGNLQASAALNMQYNNYTGTSITPTYGISYSICEGVSVGANLTTSATEGATVSSNLSFSDRNSNNKGSENGLTGSLGLSYNSRQGLQSINLSASSGKLNIGTNGLTGTGNMNFNFINNTFTPTIRDEYVTKSGTFSFSTGADFWAVDGEIGVDAFFSTQKLKDKLKSEKTYGYEYTHFASNADVTDFNRENDRSVSKNTRALPVTNYAYDVYNIQTQGMSGTFRPYSGQVGYVFDPKKSDQSYSGSGGVELEFGSGVHVGADIKFSWSDINAGAWNTPVSSYFKPDAINKIDYEEKYYKLSSDLTLDNEIGLYTERLASEKAINFRLLGVDNLKNKYEVKNATTTTIPDVNINTKIKRSAREKRNQSVQKITALEAASDAFFIKSNEYAKPHHTAGIKVLNENGSTFVFGETVYNVDKKEVSFALHKNTLTTHAEEDGTGLVGYSPEEASSSNGNGIDHYFNKVTTPAYASTFLLTSVLSGDYEDVSGDGPTDDDLGTYTKFVYQKMSANNYKWRAPYYKASYNPGFNSDPNHKRASYTYGEKESKYISKIITKTHVAIFTLSERKDGQGVDGEHNQLPNINSTSKMYKIDKIDLYSKPEAIKANLLNDNPSDDLTISAIKTAHFIYDYSLCPNVNNNSGVVENVDGININAAKGKLTLKKVYFTYRNSKMGKYTPYVFNYDQINNPAYDMKSFDVWGNYKKNEGTGRMLPLETISSVEFPYVKQNKIDADKNTASWNLTSIKLPSGGEINIETESDDYQFVQDKKAMEMFKVVGVMKAGQTNLDLSPSGGSNKLFTTGVYGGVNEADRLVIEVDKIYDESEFIEKYIGEHIDKPIFFRFMLNMIKTGNNNYDYVEGYFKINKGGVYNFSNDVATGKFYAAIPMELTDMEGGINGGRNVNPISKAGWYFGRQNMNKAVYGGQPDPSSESVKDIILSIRDNFEAAMDIFRGPNGTLRNKEQCAQKFMPNKSWIRLLNPTRTKLGGGCRVKSVKLSDKWDNMLSGTSGSGGSNLNTMEYGQVYDYTIEDGTSSGVATYEPLGAKDNPLIEPFYDKGERLVAPKEVSYVEKPFGQSFFPSPMVTYSKVTVKNLPREYDSKVVKKHATGTVVSEFYTSKDFPILTDFTEIERDQANPEPSPGFLASLIGVPIVDNTKLTMTQGFAIETNDMNGKQKSQKVYDENKNLISGVDYKYNVIDNKLNNNLTVINPDGTISNSLIGMNYDVINDFRQNYAKTTLTGFNNNVATIVLPLFIILFPLSIPTSAEHTKVLRMATTTKVVHKKGILIEKIAYDLGSSVSTKNIAWDANSGQVLLTETVNEYDDHYFSFTYPAYWKYDGMGLASNNIGMNGLITRDKNCPFDPTPYFSVLNPENTEVTLPNISGLFHVGDELILEGGVDQPPLLKVWVLGFNGSKTGMLLMDKDGEYIDDCGKNESTYNFRLVRSGYRNMQSAAMASVTSMINPIRNNDGTLKVKLEETLFNYAGTGFNPRIINASAVVYKDLWKPQDEISLPLYPTVVGEVTHPFKEGYNPYLWNTKGDWKAEKSYAYLGGRNATAVAPTARNNPRNEGFFSKFSPFYKLSSTNNWTIDEANWTYASSVTQISPFGAELENQDALNRYSSAQYGYNYTLPMAVASNSQYGEMGFEGFEETQANTKKHFGFKEGNNIVPLTNLQSHTGRNSVKVTKALPVKLSRKLKPIVKNAELRECSPVCGNMVEITLKTGPNEWSNCIPQHGNNYQCPNGIAFRRYILESKCDKENIRIIGINSPSSMNEYGTSYTFSSVPGEPNQTELTIVGYRRSDTFLPAPIRIPIFVGNYGINWLEYQFPLGHVTIPPIGENPPEEIVIHGGIGGATLTCASQIPPLNESTCFLGSSDITTNDIVCTDSDPTVKTIKLVFGSEVVSIGSPLDEINNPSTNAILKSSTIVGNYITLCIKPITAGPIHFNLALAGGQPCFVRVNVDANLNITADNGID